MRKPSLARRNFPCESQRLIDVHMGGVRGVAQSVDNEVAHPVNLRPDRLGHFLAIAQISRQQFAALLEKIAIHLGTPMEHGQGDDLGLAELKRALRSEEHTSEL